MRAKASKPRKRLPQNDAYSADEFLADPHRSQRPGQASNCSVSRRIWRTLRKYRQSGDSSVPIMKAHGGLVWTAGSALEYLSSKGRMPSLYLARSAVSKGAFDLRGVNFPA